MSEERRDLVKVLMELQTNVEQMQLSKFLVTTTKELERQDLLRKLIEKEKKLIAEIKNIESEHKKEYKEFQDEKEE